MKKIKYNDEEFTNEDGSKYKYYHESYAPYGKIAIITSSKSFKDEFM